MKTANDHGKNESFIIPNSLFKGAQNRINGLEERIKLVQHTEPPESLVVLNRLPCNTWSLWGFNLFYLVTNFPGNDTTKNNLP